jgi:hypothetical protein
LAFVLAASSLAAVFAGHHDEAREVLTFQIQKRAGEPPSVSPEFTQVGDDRVISSSSWSGDQGKRVERYQVITFRDGKILDLQGFSSRREAERFARRPTPERS